MDKKGLSRHAVRALETSLEIASAAGENAAAQHLFAALCELRDSDAYSIIKRNCAAMCDMRAALGATKTRARAAACEEMSAELEAVVDCARASARLLGDSCVGTEQLLGALLRADSAGVKALLACAKADETALRDCVRMPRDESGEADDAPAAMKTAKRHGVCEKYARDLTLAARRGELDPVVGRDAEIDRVLSSLARRKKSNVCLTGDAGVGKTAVAEGLAQRLTRGDTPRGMANKRVLALDIASLVAGTKYRGDFEDRLGELIKELTASGDAILFIDELHSVMGAGAAEGALDAANILKPALARGGFSVIGATTAAEYARFVERDGAFARRFERVDVAEPDDETALIMLRAQTPALQKHHGVVIEDDALEAAVRLSKRYSPARRLPDKALDLIDDAAARLRLGGGVGALGAQQIRELIERRRGAAFDDAESLLMLETRLRRRVIGQDGAVAAVSAAVRRSRAGVRDPDKPCGCFMLCGPTGTGKTELCRALARELFADERAFIRLDMSEFSEANSASRLIGAAPGYVGHELGGRLTDEVRRRPCSLVLFDELEKASAQTRALLLQIMEEGELSDARGETTDFRNCFIACTSNAASRAASGAQRPTGFAAQGGEADGVADAAARELEQTFSPELVNRFDVIAVFRPLTRQDLASITDNLLAALKTRIAREGYELSIGEGVSEAIVSRCRDCAEHGARPLKRAVGDYIETPLADMILSGELPRNGRAEACAVIKGGDNADDAYDVKITVRAKTQTCAV